MTELSRKRKVRAGHRGSVTRMISDAGVLLSMEGGAESARLKQRRDALASKMDVLIKLDAEILDSIDEGELENEIDSADTFREGIEIAIIELDGAIKTAADAAKDGAERAGASSLGARATRSSEATTVPITEPPSREVSPTMTDRGGATPSPTESEHSSHGVGESTDILDGSSGHHSAHVKLPKLSLKKFSGDLTKWNTFWDTFESAIHTSPSLTNIDKFSYLQSLLESSAAEAIAGLKLTSANYEEAVETLKRRFGNKQLIINRHMDILLQMENVASTNNLRGLRRLFDTVESNVRGLRSLGVAAESYGGLLSSILMSRLPSEFRLIVSRALSEEEWKFEQIIEIVQREIEARERSAGPSQSHKRASTSNPPTALSLVTGANTQANCVYCNRPHASDACTSVRTLQDRKQLLREKGRCFVCLRRNHISRNCRSPSRCSKCHGRHHTSLCPSQTADNTSTSDSSQPRPTDDNTRRATTSSVCVSSLTPILLQTARATVRDATQPESSTAVEVRVLMDTGSQRSYVTTRVREAVRARKSHTESMIIKTFGAEHGQRRDCDVVQLRFCTKVGEPLILPLVVVPHICDSVSSQPIDTSQASYRHLAGLDLADTGGSEDNLDIDLLIGSDHYWKLVTGQVLRGEEGPTAIETLLGWVLSGPADGLEETTMVNFVSAQPSHMLRVDNLADSETLDEALRRFWELESLGIIKEEHPVLKQFSQRIKFVGGRYEVDLPWKEDHSHLPTNRDLCERRLNGLLKRLRHNPEQLQLYDSVIQDQLRRGIVEIIEEPTHETGRIHYLPHHPVVRRDKETTKVRVVYDASAKASGPSLNDCLHIGPKFGQSILEILLRFRLYKTALIGDIEKAFLMISVASRDRDALRFLWAADAAQPDSRILTMRFTRVVFGVSASPFLLNATIDHHMKKIETSDRHFVDKFRRSIYVDDIVTGAATVEEAYEFCQKARSHLASASFNLRKFESNSPELRQKITEDSHLNTEPDSRSSNTRPSKKQVLGITWDPTKDALIFDIGDVAQLMKTSSPSKRNLISLATRFYDPLGVITPITIRFKMAFQKLCQQSIGWDEPLTGNLLAEWNTLTSDLQRFTPIQLPRCCTQVLDGSSPTESILYLEGYCDASQEAYAAVVYLHVEVDGVISRQFLCSKTRVAPAKKTTIPRLELLSALLLARLISTIRQALEPEILLKGVSCYTDSQVAYFWITRRQREWKQFVQNRVNEIREITPPECWKHCPGVINPADIPSRGSSPLELSERLELWLHGPQAPPDDQDPEDEMTVPEDCLPEMKGKEKTMTLLTTSNSLVLSCGDYGSLRKLLRVTAYVLRFISNAKNRNGSTTTSGRCTLTTKEIDRAKTYWLGIAQRDLPRSKNFQKWSSQFGLFQDALGLWRCGGRLKHSDLPQSAKNPILLDKEHRLTRLIVAECHERVMHGGVKATLTELRSKYWVVGGRSLVRKILQKCTVCLRFQGRPYLAPPAPPLPEFRVTEAKPFAHTGVDYAGPLYIRRTDNSSTEKVWICLFTCCVTRAVHLDVVLDMTADAFIRCFKRFASRRGFPMRVVSDNAKTFKAASRIVTNVLKKPLVANYFSSISVRWTFNLERAPWWGGMFERMIQTMKRCLRRVLKNARLTYEELLTSVSEVEMTINSRPLSYMSSGDVEEPLTPSHLLCGYRIQSLPDCPASDGDVEYNPAISRTDINRRMKHLTKTLSDFWNRWRAEYLLELRDAHRHPNRQRGVKPTIEVGDIVVVHDENLPRGLWKLGRVEERVIGSDGRIRAAAVRISSKGMNSSVLKRPLQKLYPLESNTDTSMADQSEDQSSDTTSQDQNTTSHAREPPRRGAFTRAQERIQTWCGDDQDF